jgi:ComF family protein
MDCQPVRHLQVNDWLKRVQAILMPPCCVLCGDAGQPPLLDLCAPCDADLPRNASACPRCAAPLPSGTPPGLSCGACLRRAPRFDHAIVPFRYAYPLDHLVRDLKYHGRLAYGRVLGMLLAEALLAADLPRPDVIVPVPLFPARHRERGFNQASEIARPIADRLRIPVEDRLCARVRATEDQTTLAASQRRRNVRRAFALSRRPGVRHIAILDDVVTTGSTVNEMARVFKRSGVRTVTVWAVARAAPGYVPKV